MKVVIGVSNRHVHLNKEALAELFGTGYELKCDRELVQPNQYASTSFVTIKTAKATIEHVRVMGPLRDYNQVEIARTDAYKLGLNPPIRTSGDLIGSEAIEVIGPVGQLLLKSGCIIPNRHIHMSEAEAATLGLKDKKVVKVKVDTDKGGLFDHVYIKTSPEAKCEMHIDTDDANGFNLKTGMEVELLK